MAATSSMSLFDGEYEVTYQFHPKEQGGELDEEMAPWVELLVVVAGGCDVLDGLPDGVIEKIKQEVMKHENRS
jgi:hypothetical protein